MRHCHKEVFQAVMVNESEKRIPVGDFRKALYQETNTTIIDNRRVEIENCIKIMEYSDVCIFINTTSVKVRIWGSGLKISDFKTGGLIAEGKITSVEFE